MDSDAMLLPTADGFKVVLNEAKTRGQKIRQRFSHAHELAHLLLHCEGLNARPGEIWRHRKSNKLNDEERLCDQIAAEILMPREVFVADATDVGWSIDGLKQLRELYDTSVQATASRMINLMPETCHMGIWRPASNSSEMHRLQHSIGQTARFGIPARNGLPRSRFWLIARAAKSRQTESGISPIFDKAAFSTLPKDVSAEAWAWGSKELRRVLVFYYPEREIAEDMQAIADATWRAF